MGARPVALLDSLRFGPFEEPAQRRLLDGVVAGIGGYGNCIGVPTVGGEVYFDESYRFNCLVNAMCVGIIERERLTHATAAGPGNVVLLVGADTGRDGIHGATFASVELNESSAERRPAVQVGNPFLEKCLMEVCVALAGDPRIVAMQDLGAAGLTSATAELAHRGGCGIAIDIAHVSRRETGMTPYEVMLSEFQERMLLVVAARGRGLGAGGVRPLGSAVRRYRHDHRQRPLRRLRWPQRGLRPAACHAHRRGAAAASGPAPSRRT